MRLRRLRVEALRVIEQAELELAPGLNWLVGANGSGKSSLLEGLSLLASGRSFRGGSADACIRKGAEAVTAFAELESGQGTTHRLGLRRVVRVGFEAKIDGAAVPSLSELFQRLPAVVFPADTGELVSGPSEVRRRFLDWGLFHVEQDFFELWRRYARALRQRNLLLRQGGPEAQDRAWRSELALTGEALHALRERYVASLTPHVAEVARWLLPGLGDPRLAYRAGWSDTHATLGDALAASVEQDRRLGFTGVGPHRSGWNLAFEQLPHRDMFSRGQAKLASLLMLLAQVSHFTECRKEPPVVGLDDALAELDATHQTRLASYLRTLGVQGVLASADTDAVSRLATSDCRVFHVEQGWVASPV